jgi:hemerythrin-like metal-binding protein
MKDLDWKDEYLLGIAAVDLQHERILGCFVTIMEEALTTRETWRGDSTIIRLVGLLQQHFALEESMMRAFGYPELERHIEEHRQFHAEVQGLAQKPDGMNGGGSQETLKVVQKWLQVHILQSDRHYADFFAGLPRKSVGKKEAAP